MGSSKAPPGCGGCRFLSWLGMCDYSGRTGQARGCPAGEGCTKKETGPRPRKDIRLPPRREVGWEDRYWRPSKPAPSLIALENDDTARRLYAEGRTDPAIARATGWSVTTVRNWRRRTGRPANYRRNANGNEGNEPQGGSG